MTLSQLKEMIIYIIKRETYFRQEHAERIVDEILDLVKEYIIDILNELKGYFKGGK